MPYEPDKPWERQIGESGQAYEAFAVYREAGKSRTVSAVVKQLGKSRSLLDRWKARWDWEARAAAYDNDIERQAKEQAVKGRKTMLDRHTKIAMQVQTKALQALQRLDVDKMTPKDIKEYIKNGQFSSRKVRGDTAWIRHTGEWKSSAFCPLKGI